MTPNEKQIPCEHKWQQGGPFRHCVTCGYEEILYLNVWFNKIQLLAIGQLERKTLAWQHESVIAKKHFDGAIEQRDIAVKALRQIEFSEFAKTTLAEIDNHWLTKTSFGKLPELK